MSFIEEFFKKNILEITKQDLENFINYKIEENIHLDYKAPTTNFLELSKDASAFANSAGGLIILGISEKITEERKLSKIFPDQITWCNPLIISKEQLEDNLFSKIDPKINFKIIPIRKSIDDPQVVFLIDIQQSENPPHMVNNKYYFRHNFKCEPMQHYQVADFFNKRRKPLLYVKIDILDFDVKENLLKLRFNINNKGKAIAKHVRFTANFLNLNILNIEPSNVKRIDHIRSLPSIQYDGTLENVFYPQQQTQIADIQLSIIDINKTYNINCNIFAENMEEVQDKYTIYKDLLIEASERIKKGENVYLINNTYPQF